MATITLRGKQQYQAEIRRKGHPRQTKTFPTKAQAEAWVRMEEARMDEGTFLDQRAVAKISLGEALQKYADEITPTKALGTQRQERNRCLQIQRHPLAARKITTLLTRDYVEYRKERLTQVGPHAVRLELALLSHLYTMAIDEWSWPITNVVRSMRKPKTPGHRTRRLSQSEETRLYEGIHQSTVRTPVLLEAYVRLALETGMRPGELVNLHWAHVDINAGIIQLTHTKNGSDRIVGLTHEATRILESMPRTDARLFPAYRDTAALDKDFGTACRKAGLEDLHPHDLRHEAASRIAPYVQAVELAAIFGWKSLQMALVYVNQTREEIRSKIRAVEARRLIEPRPDWPERPAIAHGTHTAMPPKVTGNVIHVSFGRA